MIAKKPKRQLLLYLMVALFPMMIWMSLMKVASGEFSMGHSGHDLQHNLYSRVEYIARTLPSDVAEQVRTGILEVSPSPRQLSVSKYVSFVSKYPSAALNHYKNDLLAFFGKSGVEAVMLDYLNYAPDLRSNLRMRGNTWRRDLDQHGIIYVIGDLFKKQPIVNGLALIGILLMLSIWFLYFLGIYKLVYNRSLLHRWAISLLFLIGFFPFYVFVTSTLANNVQSRHRAPSEFSIVVIAAIGLFSNVKRRHSEKLQ